MNFDMIGAILPSCSGPHSHLFSRSRLLLLANVHRAAGVLSFSNTESGEITLVECRSFLDKSASMM